MATITRTYETFAIAWANGSRWSGYDSDVEAAALIARSGHEGVVERSTFDVTFEASLAHLYAPGIAQTVKP
jgi:hypothetical protein